MKCTHCGNEIANESTFCPECGTGVTANTQAETTQEVETQTVETQAVEKETVDPQASVKSQASVQTQASVNPPVAPVQTEISEENLPAKFKPMGAWSYFGHSLLFSIPVVGLILLIIFATGGTRNINKRNYARSYFCGLAIFAVFVIVLVALALVFGLVSGAGTSIDSIANSVL